MRVKKSFIERSPLSKQRVRLNAEVVYEKSGSPETIWFDVPEQFAPDLSSSGNPWLCCLLTTALELREPLRLELPVDKELYQNLLEMVRIWKEWTWWNDRSLLIDAEIRDFQSVAQQKRTCVFFSGGVDSFFTALSHSRESSDPADELMFVNGFDISIGRTAVFWSIRNRLEKAAGDLGFDYVDVATNLRSTALRRVGWSRSHGTFLASVGHALEKRYSRLLISSQFDPDALQLWGGHPLTTPRFSSTTLRFEEDGTNVNRFQKTEAISRSNVALSNLTVCQDLQSDMNCSVCSKCLRTLVTMDMLGVREKATTFHTSKYSLSQIRNSYLPDERSMVFFRNILKEAVRLNRADIASAIEACLERSARISSFSLKIQRFLKSFLPRRIVKFLEYTIGKRMVAVLEHRW